MKSMCISLFAGAVGCALVQPVTAAQTTSLQEEVLYSFDYAKGDGAFPEASLIDVEGTLYGTTYGGGGHDWGTIFSVNPATGAETVLVRFGGNNNAGEPQAGLIDVNGTLYGATTAGGTHEGGALFALDLGTGAENTVYSFCKTYQICPDGSSPSATLIDSHGTLYGTTETGGLNCFLGGCGTVFAFNPMTHAERVLYSFGSSGTDGATPHAALIDVNGALEGGTLYGTSANGGANGWGTLFALQPGTGAEKVLYSFCSQHDCTDGAWPFASLVDVNGILYGTTWFGGENCHGNGQSGCGTVFSIDPNTGRETVLYSFCSQNMCTDGQLPNAGLINVGGELYGTTAYGGAYTGCGDSGGCGTVFSVDLATGAFAVVHSFGNGKDGASPYAGLLDVKDALYGTTESGGAYGDGTVFSIALH